MVTDALIVGAGPAGLTCAIWCRRLGLTAEVLEGSEVPGGQLTLISGLISDYPGVVATGFDLGARFADMAHAAGAVVALDSRVTAIQAANRAALVGAKWRQGRYLVLAMGGSPRRLHVPGEEEMYRRGDRYRGSRDAARLAGKRVVVVGGGDRAIENALMLDAAHAHVTLLSRSPELRARPQLQAALDQRPSVARVQGATVQRIAGVERTEGIEFLADGQSRFLPADAVLIYAGLMPNTELVVGQIEREPDGRVRTDAVGQTSLPGVYAVGDIALAPAYSSISACTGQAMMAAKHMALQG